jgi:hypothetical protein
VSLRLSHTPFAQEMVSEMEQAKASSAFSATGSEAALPIQIRFAREVPDVVRARMAYAFRVFAAIYNYRVVEEDSEAVGVRVVYGDPKFPSGPGLVAVPARYAVDGGAAGGRRFSRSRYANEEFPLAFGRDEKTGHPDWLGEIFQWLSSSHESRIVERDSVGRIPCFAQVFRDQGISARKPWAALLMGWLENALRNGNGTEALCRAPSPVAGVEHMVVCSHDIDFYYTNRGSALLRLVKNLGISLRIYRSWSFFQSNAVMILEVLGGKRTGDYLPALLNAIQENHFHSTFFVVTNREHPRDPNYRLQDMTGVLVQAERNGSSVCVHGSYTSVLGGGDLKLEVTALENVLGKKPLGNRQHWLRFDSHEKLFHAVENSELVFDSTLGFPEATGFRNGASFAFPPYDFREERACNFLEIPLVLMDGSLESESRASSEGAQRIADEVLAESRRLGWGGVSVLWHNPMEALGVPKETNQVFWKCAEKRTEFKEIWMSAEEFLESSLGRYQNAGLLKGVRVHA